MVSAVTEWLCNLWYFKSNATKHKFAKESEASQRVTRQNVINQNVWYFVQNAEENVHVLQEKGELSLKCKKIKINHAFITHFIIQ